MQTPSPRCERPVAAKQVTVGKRRKGEKKGKRPSLIFLPPANGSLLACRQSNLVAPRWWQGDGRREGKKRGGKKKRRFGFHLTPLASAAQDLVSGGRGGEGGEKKRWPLSSLLVTPTFSSL